MAYNVLFGRPMMKARQMVTVVYCLTVKFRTSTEKARECQASAIKLTQKMPAQAVVMEIREIRACEIPIDELIKEKNVLI